MRLRAQLALFGLVAISAATCCAAAQGLHEPDVGSVAVNQHEAALVPRADKRELKRPDEDDFYKIPENIDDYPLGAIIRDRTPPAPIALFAIAPVSLKSTHQILYKTTDSFNKSTATVLTVLVPGNADYTKIVSKQVFEDASFSDCAPSYFLQQFSNAGGVFGSVIPQAEFIIIEFMLTRGWIVIIPDYEGPKSAFLANMLGGHAVLDGVRAALSSGGITGIKDSAEVVIWGYSGGSLPTAFAAELHASYAPELPIKGAILGGGVPDIRKVVEITNKTPQAALLPAGLLGLAHEYAEVDAEVKSQLKPEFRDYFLSAEKNCLVGNVARFGFRDVLLPFKDPTFIDRDPIRSVLLQNGMGHNTPQIPIFMYKGVMDSVRAVADTDLVYDKYCEKGARVEYIRDKIGNHPSSSVTSYPDAIQWITDRFNGKQVNPVCSKKTVISSLFKRNVGVIPRIYLNALFNVLGRTVGPSARVPTPF